MMEPSLTSAFGQITRLAADRRVHQAFRWLHLQQQRIFRWHLDLVNVPAPPFGEAPRAAWLAERFRELGLEDVFLDEVGNVIGRLRGNETSDSCALLSAHIDTVFPPDTLIEPVSDGLRLLAPGACDNGAGITGLLAIAAAMIDSGLRGACDLYFIGNVGEEGDGNLRGVRHLYLQAPWRDRIHAHLVLDGAGDTIAVTHALGSHRYRAVVTGPGGHSWTNAGSPNPIVILSRAIARLADLPLPDSPRTTLSVGIIEGGTAINAIPEHAEARFDFRSTDPQQLIRLEVELYRAVEDAVIAANLDPSGRERVSFDARAHFLIERIGDRPAGYLPDDSRLMDLLRSVDRQLGLRTEPRVASTDANIPLSLGIPAVTLGAGGAGGGIHTRNEWYDATGRELGLRRILLLLLALADHIA